MPRICDTISEILDAVKFPFSTHLITTKNIENPHALLEVLRTKRALHGRVVVHGMIDLWIVCWVSVGLRKVLEGNIARWLETWLVSKMKDRSVSRRRSLNHRFLPLYHFDWILLLFHWFRCFDDSFEASGDDWRDLWLDVRRRLDELFDALRSLLVELLQLVEYWW